MGFKPGVDGQVSAKELRVMGGAPRPGNGGLQVSAKELRASYKKDRSVTPRQVSAKELRATSLLR